MTSAQQKQEWYKKLLLDKALNVKRFLRLLVLAFPHFGTLKSTLHSKGRLFESLTVVGLASRSQLTFTELE